MSHDNRTESAAHQAAEAERDDGGPLHGCHRGEDQRGNAVGGAEHNVLGGVGMCQCLTADAQEQCEQQDTRRGPEVAAVNADREDRDALQGERAPGLGDPSVSARSHRTSPRRRRSM